MRRAAFAVSLLASAGPAWAQPARPITESEIVVTASPLAGGKDRFATIVETVNRDQILQTGGANLSDVLAQTPGVSGAGFASGASRPVIRGMDANRVKILEDGVGSSDVSDVGPDHGVPIDPLSARSIEVVRGAATLRYGSQAIGGVVNAINNRVPLTLPDKPLAGEIAGSYGANGDARQGSVLLDGRAGQFAFHADGFARRVGDYETPDGVQANSFFRGDGYSAGGAYFFGADNASHIGIASVHYDADYGIPSDTTFIDMRQTKALVNGVFHVGAGALQSVNLDGGYADYVHDERDPDGAILSTFRNREWDARLEAVFGQIGPLDAAALGVQLGNRDFSAGGEGGDYLRPAETQNAAIFAFTEAPIGQRLHLQAAARVEGVDVSGTPISNTPTSLNFTPVSGSIGALFDVSQRIKLGLTLTSAARAPGQTELFARGPHDGPGTFETGDPNLAVERANSIEATLRVRDTHLQIDGALWLTQFDNYIYGQLTGNLCDETGDCGDPPGGDLRQLNYGQQDARFWGAEMKAAIDLKRFAAGTLQGTLLADYVRAEFTRGGNVPRIEPYRIGGGLSWDGDRFDAGATLTYVGAQKDVPAGDTTTDSYVALDAHAALRPFQSRNFEIALIGHNLTDDVQRNAVSLNRDLVEMPGRDVRVVLRQTF